MVLTISYVDCRQLVLGYHTAISVIIAHLWFVTLYAILRFTNSLNDDTIIITIIIFDTIRAVATTEPTSLILASCQIPVILCKVSWHRIRDSTKILPYGTDYLSKVTISVEASGDRTPI